MRKLTIPRIHKLDLRTGLRPLHPGGFHAPDDWFETKMYFGAFGADGPVLRLRLSADDIEWNWPAMPACAGRRDAMDFPPVVLGNGETLKINQVYGPFGLTVLGAEVLHDN